MKTPADEDEPELFRRAVQGIKPLICDKIQLIASRPKPVPRQRLLDDRRVLHDMFSDKFDPAELETGEELVYLKAGVQHAVLRKLRRGQYSVTAELDLHGMFAAEARTAVAGFLRMSWDSSAGCVRIVHGKGYGSWQKQPVLKNKLNHWLRQHEHVLAFCSARQVDGGTGAVYVLVKRR